MEDNAMPATKTSSPADKKLVDKPLRSTLVRVKALREVFAKTPEAPEGRVHQIGEELEVDETTAAQWEHPISAPPSFYGTRASEDVPFVGIRRAERVG